MYTQFTKLNEIAQNILLARFTSPGVTSRRAKSMKTFLAAVSRAKARKPRVSSPRVLGYQFVYSYGSETILNDILESLGAINVGAEHGLRLYDGINSEQVLRWNPEWIVAGANRGESAQVLRRASCTPFFLAIRLTTAARKGQIVVLELNVFLPGSPFTTLILGRARGRTLGKGAGRLTARGRRR